MSESMQFVISSFFFNFFTSLSLCCWLFTCFYYFFYFLLLSLLVKLRLSIFLSCFKLTPHSVWRYFTLLYIIVVYEKFWLFVFFNFHFIIDFYHFLWLFCLLSFYLVFKLVDFFLKIKNLSFSTLVNGFYNFIISNINVFILLSFILYIFLFFANCGSFERYYGGGSFTSSLFVFFLTQFNTLSAIVLLLSYFLFTIFYKYTDIVNVRVFFLRCIFLSVFLGIALNILELTFLNSILAYKQDGVGPLSGIIMLFENLFRINNENLIFLITFSLGLLFFWFVILFYSAKREIEISTWYFLRFNVFTVFFQNAIFLEYKSTQNMVLLFAVVYNLKFLVVFFFRLIRFMSECFFSYSGPFKGRLHGLFGLNLIDFFNLRGIIKPLNWVYIDENKSILKAEPTTEVIVSAKLKSILAAAKVSVYVGLVGGSYVVPVIATALIGCLDVHLVVSDGSVTILGDSVASSVNSPFRDKIICGVDSYIKSVIDGLDQTPSDQVPLRKWDQTTHDRFDAVSDGDVISRRNLAREGWVKFFFCAVVGDLLWKLIWRLIFDSGGEDGGNDGGPGPQNDTFVKW